jgi:hypothetical protein
MKHIKPISLFEMDKGIKLFDVSDPAKDVEIFMEVLDFPRQGEDGFLEQDGEIDYPHFIKGTKYEPGYNLFKSDPTISDIPEIKEIMDEWKINSIEIKDNNDIYIKYNPMSKKEWVDGDYEESAEMDYYEYVWDWEKQSYS